MKNLGSGLSFGFFVYLLFFPFPFIFSSSYLVSDTCQTSNPSPLGRICWTNSSAFVLGHFWHFERSECGIFMHKVYLGICSWEKPYRPKLQALRAYDSTSSIGGKKRKLLPKLKLGFQTSRDKSRK